MCDHTYYYYYHSSNERQYHYNQSLRKNMCDHTYYYYCQCIITGTTVITNSVLLLALQ
jgi:hypothetical protein